jgi:RNA polymerase sigma-70 factor (ECF subfamily)
MLSLGTNLDSGGTGTLQAGSGKLAPDQDAVQRMARGDADALATVYDRHIRAVFSLALRIVSDEGEAQDVVQEVFAQAWTQAGRYDAARGSVSTWLLTMTRSRAIYRLRSRRAKADSTRLPEDLAVVDLPDPARGQEHAVLQEAAANRLRAALQELPFLQRVAIELAYYEGLTQSEIAERLEQPLGTVKTRIRTGLLKLREARASDSAS